MKETFNTFEYVEDLGRDLVRDFEKSGKTTHPHAVGEGREKSAINRLREILPEGVGIGSGFVIDSYGNVSSQCDIIIYEKDLALKFIHNDERYCYYNCESVIAVGEVKSDLSIRDLKDSINKLKNIKNLKRNLVGSLNLYRNYLTRQGIIGSDKERFDYINNECDQIFTFLVCNSIKVSNEKIIEIYNDFNLKKYEYMNSIISIDGKCYGYGLEIDEGKFVNKISNVDANLFIYEKRVDCFCKLVTQLFFVIEHGRSVKYMPSIYISGYKKSEIELILNRIIDN